MLIATVISAGLLLGLAVLHALSAKYFTVHIVNGKRPINEKYKPRATVILTIRGCDPSLERNLANLLQQDYENYDVIAVVDHRIDAAWSVLHHVKSEFDTENKLTIIELCEPLESCSLKCSALVQAIGELPCESEIIVLVDADVNPHEQWLVQAISPLSDPSVGVVTGNQWFEPQHDDCSSLIRSIWNAGALVPTAFLANTWAGTCAMRIEDIRRANLVETWKQSIVDDGPIRRAMQPLGLHIVFNPELIMVNRENCTQKYVHRYIARMLTWSRFYEKTYINTFFHMVFLVLATVGTVGLAFVALTQLAWPEFAIASAAFAISVGLNFVGYCTVRSGIARIERRRDHELDRLPTGRAWKLLLLIPICQFCYGGWMLKSLFTRRVNWRQITYEVRAHDKIRMTGYRPIKPDTGAVSKVSI